MILVCPKCGTENPVPDRYDPSKIYRCGNCNFLLEDIRKLSDNELMILDSRLTAQVISEDMRSYSDHYRGPDFPLLAAVTNEVNRRFGAASWFWRRWRKPLYEYKKWVQHEQQKNEMAHRQAIVVGSRVESLGRQYPDDADVRRVGS
jgi:hypothetical protein